MCCDLCPKYEECSIKDQLKNDCCKVCPEHNSCFPDAEEDCESEDY